MKNEVGYILITLFFSGVLYSFYWAVLRGR